MSSSNCQPPKLFFIAGEVSGDNLGASLMARLQELCPSVVIEGVGGSAMESQGLKSIVSMEALSIMGFTGVIKSIKSIFALRRTILNKLRSGEYRGVVTIDAPGFNLWLMPAIHRLGVPHIHYVAPTVWAWKSYRAKKIARYLEAVLCLFPFEPGYFTPYGLAAPFVGHPVVEKFYPPKKEGGEGGRSKRQSLCLLPGSRRSEIATHLPLFLEAATLFLSTFARPEEATTTASTKATSLASNGLAPNGIDTIVIPTLPHRVAIVEKIVRSFQTLTCPTIKIVTDSTQHLEAMQESAIALAASGTVTLELACTLTPMVVAYKTSWLNGFLARQLLKVPHVSLVNILLNEAVVPECLQENCTPTLLSTTLGEVYRNRDCQIKSLALVAPNLTPTSPIVSSYTPSGMTPSMAAAQQIFDRWLCDI